jgi:hypothetical protein
MLFSELVAIAKFSMERPLQGEAGGLGFALFLTPRGRDGEGGYCGRCDY